MAVSDYLAITQVAEQQNQKYITINDGVKGLERATNRIYTNTSVGAGPITLTEAEFTRNMIFEVSGGSANFDVVVPSLISGSVTTNRVIILVNNDTTYDVTLKTDGSGATEFLTPGKAGLYYVNGVDVFTVVSGSAGQATFSTLSDTDILGASEAYKNISIDGTGTHVGYSYQSPADSDIFSVSAGSLNSGDVVISEADTVKNFFFQVAGVATANNDIIFNSNDNGSKVFVVQNPSTSTSAVGARRGSTSFTINAGQTLILHTTGALNNLTKIGHLDDTLSAQFTDLNDTPANYTGASKQNVRVNVAGDGIIFEDRPYDIGIAVPDKPLGGVNIEFVRVSISRECLFPAGFAGSVGSVRANPTTARTWNIKKNGTVIGTVDISTGGAFTFTTNGNATQAFSSGDVLSIEDTLAQDATLSDVSLTLLGKRND